MAILLLINMQDLTICGWNQNGKIVWIDEAFPEGIVDIIVDPTCDDNTHPFLPSFVCSKLIK